MKILPVVLIIGSLVAAYFVVTTPHLKQTRSYSIEGEIAPSPVMVADIYESNVLINSVLTDITESEFFKIFLVNIVRDCPFWRTSHKCKMNFCPIEEEESLGNKTHVKVRFYPFLTLFIHRFTR